MKILDIKKYGTWLYKVETRGNGLLELGQGYEPGWIALSNRPLGFNKLNHVKVNSWANGWIIPTGQPIDQSTIYLLFWPQLLEWAGMVFGFAVLIYLLVDKPGR